MTKATSSAAAAGSTRLLERSPRPWHNPPPARHTRRASIVVACVTSAIAAATVSAGAALLLAGGSGQAPDSATAGPAQVDGTADCAHTTEGDKLISNAAGGTGSGPDAILAFEHAYYVTRSGAAARAVIAPDGAVPAIEHLQAGIDSLPTGTKHCVVITPAAEGFDIELSEWIPGKPANVWRQHITTTVQDGRTLIKSISATG
ncbi:hypothetical protein ACTWPB_12580 [Nocardia sp. IBHARD005]|uniref:hypothetical protein n=1 Tax=Nocardia sp. IBHARD005 TaxID=3457765 RepID=UPI004057DCCC